MVVVVVTSAATPTARAARTMNLGVAADITRIAAFLLCTVLLLFCALDQRLDRVQLVLKTGRTLLVDLDELFRQLA